MSATANIEAAHDHEEHNQSFITKYIFSLDHKIIGKQYLIAGIIMAVIGILMSMLFRIQLAWPEESQAIFSFFLGEKWAPDGVMTPDAYLGLVTMHGTIMVFFVLTAGLSGTFSNYLIPIQIGARDMASGFINMLSSWIFIIACIIMLSSLFVQGVPAMGGWTVYPPLSALPEALSGSGTGMVLWIVAMAFFIAQSLLGAINYIVTILNYRTEGMSMTRLPLSVWSFLITAIVAVLSFPVLLAAVLLLLMDHSFGTSIYLYDIYIQGEVLHQQ